MIIDFNRYRCKLIKDNTESKLPLRSFLGGSFSAFIPMPILDGIRLNNGQAADFIPQGICFVENDILISAYPMHYRPHFGASQEERELHAILARLNTQGEIQAIYELPFDAHVGGVCFDGVNVWVCSGDNRIAAFSYDEMRKLEGACSEGCVDIENAKKYELETGGRTSFCTWDDGQLWTGSYSRPPEYNVEAKAFSYCVNSITYSSLTSNELIISERIQGICFFDFEGEKYVAMSQSGSCLYIYRYRDFLDEKLDDYVVGIKLPAMLEQIVEKDGRLFLLFESTGKAYRKWFMPVVDRIWELDVKQIISDF